MNRDFVEMLSALSDAGAEFLIVGAHALAAHGVVRATGDLDIWVRATNENAARVWGALRDFGAPLEQLRQAELSEPDLVFQIGLPPQRIDLLTSISGVDFEEAWNDRVFVEVSGMRIPVLSRTCLVQNKRSVGRPRDLADIADLENLPPSS